MKNHYKIIGQRMQTRRKELKITQSTLAEAVGVSNNHISAIENGSEHPSLPTLLNICDELHVTPDFLLLGGLRGNNVPQNIVESLQLCNEDDLAHIQMYIEMFVQKNVNPPIPKE